MSVSPVDEFFAVCARIRGSQLIDAECRSLTGGTPGETGVAACARVDRIGRAAYVQQGCRTIATAGTFEGLAAAVAAIDFDADGFRVDIHDPARLAERPTPEMAMILADAIPFGPDLKRPRHRFVATIESNGLRFGEVIADYEQSYRPHDDKPWTTSSSLDSRFARALVNLVPDARSVVDPCCGAGSIVLEAAALGLEAFGVDWKPAMVGMTTKNLEHFGHRANVVRADSRTHAQLADAVVTDLPYGHAIESDEATIRRILDNAITMARHAVFVAHADITTWLTDAGYAEIEVVSVTKRPGFTRWVHTARR